MLSGSAVINETDYDFGLPFRVGYDPFGGLYRGDLNLQVYWDDDPAKLTRFMDSLNQGDYILIPTNHKYGQITRIPERYPLTTEYYRQLLGCPADEDIIHCYRVAEPGTYQGSLGYELTAVFTSYPTLGPLVINDQAAEEAFTFYDHPKVLVFKKSADYDPIKVQTILSAVDLTRVVRLTPRQANSYEYKDLLLPPNSLAEQRAGGTWSELFSYDALQNRFPALGLVFWYVFIFVLGVATYPLARLALPGLGVGAYALSRMVFKGRAAYLNWVLGQRFMPPIAILIPLVTIYKDAGLRDNDSLYGGYLGLMMIYALMNLPIALLLMKSFFDDVPKDVDEAAMIDGATRWQSFSKVVLPMVRGGVAASAVLVFIFSWTEFLLSLFLTTSIRTVPVKIQTFVTSTGNEWGFIAALGTAAAIPSFIFILLVQRHLVRGLTLGSLKE